MNNIYSKMQKARCEFQNTTLKKSGHNKFAGYKYFELGDFMPTINGLLDKQNLCSHMSFYPDKAELIIINSENPEETLVFSSPMSSANLKGCHDVQNLGAVQTYLRRYLWVNAFEIVEGDGLDSTTGADDKKPKQTKGDDPKLEPLMKLVDVARARKIRDVDMFKAMSIKDFKEFNRIAENDEHLKFALSNMSNLIAVNHAG